MRVAKIGPFVLSIASCLSAQDKIYLSTLPPVGINFNGARLVFTSEYKISSDVKGVFLKSIKGNIYIDDKFTHLNKLQLLKYSILDKIKLKNGKLTFDKSELKLRDKIYKIYEIYRIDNIIVARIVTENNKNDDNPCEVLIYDMHLNKGDIRYYTGKNSEIKLWLLPDARKD